MAETSPDLARITDGSRVVTSLRTGTAAVTQAARWFTEAAKHSFLYRWLTKEPEPDVIVIDLRETYAVGPVLALLDRLVTASSPTVHTIDRAWQASTLYRMGDWVAGWIEAGLETRTGEVILELFEPPDPPEEE